MRNLFHLRKTLFVILILTLGLSGCVSSIPNPLDIPVVTDQPVSGSSGGQSAPASNPGSGQSAPVSVPANPSGLVPTLTYTLQTALGNGGMSFVGVGGEIDGQVNPDLTAAPGDVIELILVNGDGVEHDWTLEELNAQTEKISTKDSQASVVFEVSDEGEYAYFCSVPGHRQAGMEGRLIVGGGDEAVAAEAPSIVYDPANVPAPIGDRGPETVHFEIETPELEGQLADGTTFTYWTFNGTVPGPFLRVRVGDTVEVVLRNPADSKMVHSIDLHAATGPGGGAAVTQAAPGEEKSFSFKALNPGLYVYHCATPMVAHHIANGMYGLILVEPEGGLPEVDREFYVMQGEIYTTGAFGEKGLQETDVNKLLNEDPEYVVFNGAVGALTEQMPLQAKTGESVRIFFGVGGPNFISSFHVIGEIFDRVYDQGATSAPLENVQTTVVPAGGATWVEFNLEVPGRYLLVDHALARLERGLVGFLIAEGPDNPEVFFSEEAPAGGH